MYDTGTEEFLSIGWSCAEDDCHMVTCSGNVEPESPIQHGSKLSVGIISVIYLVKCGMFRSCLWRCSSVSKFMIFLRTIMPDSSIPRSNRHMQGKPPGRLN